MTSPARTIGRIALGAALLFAGTSHLTFAREEFAAQVPPWIPVGTDTVVVGSGVVELALGGALVALPKQRVAVGWVVAAFFVAIFPGNIAQFTGQRDAFGLDSDAKRFVRLLFQPVLVVLALEVTEARSVLAARKADRR
jgi:uncharacterized membrane protein